MADILTPQQSLAARALLKWSRVRLGAKCSLGEGTIKDFEDGIRILLPQKRAAIRQAFELAGVVFAAEDPYLRRRGPRASEKGAPATDSSRWNT